MKDYIRNLISAIARLQKPLALDELAKLLLPRHEFFYALATPPADLEAQWSLLYSLVNKLATWTDLVGKAQRLPGLENDLRQMILQRTANRQRRKELDSLMADLKDTSGEPYKKIYETWTDELRRVDPLLAVPNPSDSRGKLAFLLDYRIELRLRERLLQRDEMHLSLHVLFKEQTDTIIKIRALGVDLKPGADLPSLIHDLESRISQLKSLQQTLPRIHDRLTLELSQQDIHNTINDLETQCALLEEKVPKLSVQLDNMELDEAIKTDAVREYCDPDIRNKEALLLKKQGDIQWTSSYFNVPSWYQWFSDSSFTDKWTIQQKILGYLHLYHHRENEAAALESLREKLGKARTMIPGNANISQLPDDSPLLQEARDLLQSWDGSRSAGNDSPGSLITEIITVIPRLPERLEQLELSKSLLESLRSIGQTILSLRTNQAYLADPGVLPPSQETLAELQKTSMLRQDQLQYLNKQSGMCQLVIELLEDLAEFEDEQKQLLKTNKALLSQIQSIKKACPAPGESNSLTEQIDRVYQQITQDVNELLDLPEIASTNTIVFEPVDGPGTNYSHEEEERSAPTGTLFGWNRQIMGLLQHTPEGFTAWYRRLYEALQESELIDDENLVHQRDQLLHDIHFELQNPQPDDRFGVLRAYQTLCPRPSYDWQKLTAMKPPVPSGQQILPQLDQYPLRARFDSLYAQCSHLKKSHEREAMLLEQATRNLHKMALLAQQNPHRPALAILPESLMEPRYESLHRHRGFLKVCQWLAELCTNIMNLFSAQEPNSYRQRCLFSRTESIKRLDATLQSLVETSAYPLVI